MAKFPGKKIKLIKWGLENGFEKCEKFLRDRTSRTRNYSTPNLNKAQFSS